LTINFSRRILLHGVPWNRVLLEKLIPSQLVRKFLAFYGTERFITVFTTAHHWTLF
jgi:hypothetical protein